MLRGNRAGSANWRGWWRVVGGGEALAALGLALVSCSDLRLTSPLDEEARSAGAVKFWDANAAVLWNGQARDLIIANRSPAPFAIRSYAILSLAQYEAAVNAEKNRTGNERPSIRGAIAGASVAALSYLYPAQASVLRDRLAEFLVQPAWPGESQRDLAAGVAIGEAIGEQVVSRAQTDNFFAPGTVSVPAGPCVWFSNSPPVGALWGRAKPFLLDSTDQFRPPPPPSCDSPAFAAALAEVRHFSDTRTPEQDASAKFWDFPAGTFTPPGYWNEKAAALILEYHRNELQAAHAFALMNMVAYDAIVASHEAKYFYWLLRPTMADPSITLSIPLPNFPSYPSNHAAVSGGMARVLAHFFPAEKDDLDALADEAALSRVLGGIHYRFDGEAGLTLGREIAAWAVGNDVRGHEPFGLE
jgi:hypothetical protein